MNKPIYHITPEKGWMNDPNGLVEYNGVYHVFYQADPEHLINENIGWGHKISSDLLHWEECQPALLPDQSYDRDGCFTGSAVIKDDKMYLLYTGHVNQESGYIETQNLAVSKDGIHFEKYDGNPVIKNPPADTTMRFRDPKIWEKMEIIMQLSVGRQKINAEKLYITEAGTCRSIHIAECLQILTDPSEICGNARILCR